MRKKLFLLFLLINLHLNAQTIINGLSVFKINTTKESVIDSLKQSGYNLKDCKNIIDCEMPSQDYGKTIFKTESNPDQPTRSFSNLEDYNLYLINGFTAAGIKLNTIKLHFYKGILFKIYIDDDYGLTSLLIKKYPDIKIRKDSKDIECSSSIAGNYKRTEVTTSLLLRDDEFISSEIKDKEYFDSKCKKNTYMYFTIFDKKKNDFIETENNKEWRRLHDIYQKKKNNLNEL